MSKFTRQFTHITDSEKQNPLMYLFFLETLAWGLAFVAASGTSAVEATVLYSQNVATFGVTIGTIWGVVAVLVVLGSLIGIYLRKSWLGQTVSLGGFAVWMYAGFLYMLGGYWLHLLAVALPNILFWIWWFFIIQSYHRKYGG
jgi:hypothetical protein